MAGGRRDRGAAAGPVDQPPRCGHRPGADAGPGEPVAVRPDPSAGPGDDLLAVGPDREAGPTPGEPADGEGPRSGARHRGRRARAVRVRVLPPAGDHPQGPAAGRGLRDHRRRRRDRRRGAQVRGGPVQHPPVRADELPDGRPGEPAAGRRRGRGRLQQDLQAVPRTGCDGRGVAGRGPGALPVGPDRVLREPLARAGVGLPLVGRVPAGARSRAATDDVEDTFAPGGPLPESGPAPGRATTEGRGDRDPRLGPQPGAGRVRPRPGVGGRTPRVGAPRQPRTLTT